MPNISGFYMVICW